ncbi:MAG: superinfection immunity protein [Pirellulales bacterium]|nr:superinfection immunity protein [Pirellulales bacterium]
MSDDAFKQQCPHCQTAYMIGPAHFGRRVKCARCGNEFRALSGPPVPPPPPPATPPSPIVSESERFGINTERRQQRSSTSYRKPKRTRGQNINAVVIWSLVGVFVLLLLGVVLQATSSSSSRGYDDSDANPIAALIFGPFLVVAGGLVYLLPTVVAYSRDHNNTMPIALINVFFGWTLIGWVGSMAWALSSDIKSKRVYVKKVIVHGHDDDEDW